MRAKIDRRRFLAASAVAAGALTAGGRLKAAEMKTTLRKALIGKPDEGTLKSWKAVGFEGIESNAWNVSPADAAKARSVAEGLGMRIHSVMRAWINLNSSNAGAVNNDLASVETALEAAQGYGADAILLVPCRIGGMPIPQAWEFDIKFDEKTGHLTQVVAGDNTPYQAYIEAHNHATDTSREALQQVIPAAEKTGVIIALENVWNNLWVKPDLFAHFVRSFDSPWIQTYFDIGNHVKYAPPQEWIRALGKTIVKCHVKDYTLNADGRTGNWADIRDGSVDWPAVRQLLDQLGHKELWMTIEGSGGLSLEERSKRLDLIIAGK